MGVCVDGEMDSMFQGEVETRLELIGQLLYLLALWVEKERRS